jgi:hypothetical protein
MNSVTFNKLADLFYRWSDFLLAVFIKHLDRTPAYLVAELLEPEN